MSSGEAFEIQVDNGVVRGVLHRPAHASAESPCPVVLVCRGVWAPADDAGALFDELCDQLVQSGVAFVRFDHRCANMILEDFDAHTAGHDIEDAMAVLRWTLRRSEIDRARVGVIGYSLGAIAATAVCINMPSVARLCLLNAVSAFSVGLGVSGKNGSHGSNGTSARVDPAHIPASYSASLAAIDSAREAAAHERPTLVVHGSADRIVDLGVSFDYARVFMDAKRPVEHIQVARGDHAFSGVAARGACVDRVREFFSVMTADRATEPVATGA